MENERKFIVYKHTSPDGKCYIGMTSKTLEERSDINGHGYRGNKEFITDIKKYGWDNYQHEVLEVDLNEEEARHLEQYYIELWQTDNPEFGYNQSKGGEKPNMLGKKHTEEAKKKMSESLSGENAPWFGKHLQEEAKTKLSNSAKIRLSIPENNPMYGKQFTEEHKQHISEALKGKRTGENNPFFGKHHTEEARRKNSESHKGKNYGRCGEKHPLYGKHWCNNGDTELQAFECPDGFTPGRLYRPRRKRT